jgi:hypothetical protein
MTHISRRYPNRAAGVKITCGGTTAPTLTASAPGAEVGEHVGPPDTPQLRTSQDRDRRHPDPDEEQAEILSLVAAVRRFEERARRGRVQRVGP